jgi:hypothetical protein
LSAIFISGCTSIRAGARDQCDEYEYARRREKRGAVLWIGQRVFGVEFTWNKLRRRVRERRRPRVYGKWEKAERIRSFVAEPK